MNDLKRLLGYMGPYRKDMILGMLLVIIESSFEMVIPVLMSDIIDTGVAQGDVPAIMTTGLQMAACAVLALITGPAVCPVRGARLLRFRRAHPRNRVRQSTGIRLCQP